MRNRTNFNFHENEVEAQRSEKLPIKNVNLCLLDSVESIAQCIKILQKTTGGLLLLT